VSSEALAVDTVRAAPARRERLAARLGRLGGIVLGIVLLVAAGLKALDPLAFGAEIQRQGLGFGLPPLALALAALAVETALGAALLVDLRRTATLVAATLLVLFFLALTGLDVVRAARGDLAEGSACGCFGNLVERTPREAFVQDLTLLVPALVLAWVGRPGARRRVWPRALTVAGATLLVAGFAAGAPGWPLDDLATRLRPGVELATLCAGSGDARVCLTDAAPALATGSHLVVIADPDAPEFAEVAERLNVWTRAGGVPPVRLLADLAPEDRQALFWAHAPAFDVQAAPAMLLRPLHRRLPRSFRVEEGRVAETWSGLPPTLAAGSA
jgi:hypothetical protein